MIAQEFYDIHETFADVEFHIEQPKGKYLYSLSFAALGIVYGDIGTSPLYALRECFYGSRGISPTPANIYGVLSLICWSLIIVISIKYLVFVVRANNEGEGGVLSLAALATPIKPSGIGEKWILIALGVFGAALLYGDGVLTPAISVLGAMEGLTVATPVLTLFIVPATIIILIGLFFLQKRGTALVGKLFAPVTLLWFAVLAILGIIQIANEPHVLNAVNPFHGINFFIRNGLTGFVILGSVFLVVTGGEALYADMGHFGSRPIRLTWFVLVLPALLLNYFGQGALLLQDPSTAINDSFLQSRPHSLELEFSADIRFMSVLFSN